MGLLDTLLKDDSGKAEAKAAKPLINARADQARMEGVAAMIPAITESFKNIGITDWPEIKATQNSSWEAQAKERAEVLGAMVGSVMKGIADTR